MGKHNVSFLIEKMINITFYLIRVYIFALNTGISIKHGNTRVSQ